MTLTTVIGSSGSGKTTFLRDLYNHHKCIYIRQYHNIRPYIRVSSIPNFDPKLLPYWSIYENENVDQTIQVGGKIAGQDLSGLSGGQRKILIFELIYQRTLSHKNLLMVFDEPFAGVTDDFIPYMTQRLIDMSQNHNIVLVTNDHVTALTSISDNTIQVSAIDRKHVQVNCHLKVDRKLAIEALSLGNCYVNEADDIGKNATTSSIKVIKTKTTTISDDVKFFFNVEVIHNAALSLIGLFTIISFVLFYISFYGSDPSLSAFVIIGSSMISFFCIYPYLLSLVEWRNSIIEESEALVHSSKELNQFFKLLITYSLVLIASLLQYGFVNAVISGNDLSPIKYWIAILFDYASLTFYLINVGIYTTLPFELTQIIGSLPFLFMIFFSTTFCPGSGLPYVKELRYLFPRFYFWCMLPGVDIFMEGCPANDTQSLVYLILTSFIGMIIFIMVKGICRFRKVSVNNENIIKRNELITSQSHQYKSLQLEIFGERKLHELLQDGSSDHCQLNNSNNSVSTQSDSIDVHQHQSKNSSVISSHEALGMIDVEFEV